MHRGTQLLCAANPRKPVTQRVIHGGLDLLFFPVNAQWRCLCLPVYSKKLCGWEVGGASGLNLLNKKRKTQRADRVQWPSFLQAGTPVSGYHIGHSTASDFRAERAVCRVGGQMEGGCTALLSSAGTQPLPSSLTSHCSFIYLFSSSCLSSSSHSPSAVHHFIIRNYFSVLEGN